MYVFFVTNSNSIEHDIACKEALCTCSTANGTYRVASGDEIYAASNEMITVMGRLDLQSPGFGRNSVSVLTAIRLKE